MPFTPGDPNINRTGRPVGSKSFTTKVKEALRKVSEDKYNGLSPEALIIKKILEKALEGDGRMIELIWNYMDGKPSQELKGNFKVENTDGLTDEQRKKLDFLLNPEKEEPIKIIPKPKKDDKSISTTESDKRDISRESIPDKSKV